MVFQIFLKIDIDGELIILTGKEFQTLGPW